MQGWAGPCSAAAPWEELLHLLIGFSKDLDLLSRFPQSPLRSPCSTVRAWFWQLPAWSCLLAVVCLGPETVSREQPLLRWELSTHLFLLWLVQDHILQNALFPLLLFWKGKFIKIVLVWEYSFINYGFILENSWVLIQMFANTFQSKVIFRDSCWDRWLMDISGVFTFEDSLLMNVFDLNLTKNCNIILCTFSLYSVNKLSCKQIKYLSYLFTLPFWYCDNVYSDNSLRLL